MSLSQVSGPLWFSFLLALEEQLSSPTTLTPVNPDSLAFISSPQSLAYCKMVDSPKRMLCWLPRYFSFLSNCNRYETLWGPCKFVWWAILLFWLITRIIGYKFSFSAKFYTNMKMTLGWRVQYLQTMVFWIWFLSTIKTWESPDIICQVTSGRLR